VKVQTVTQTSSLCKTEAFTAENAEYAESGMGTSILHLSDLHVFARDTGFFSRPFVALTQDAKIAKRCL